LHSKFQKEISEETVHLNNFLTVQMHSWGGGSSRSRVWEADAVIVFFLSHLLTTLEEDSALGDGSPSLHLVIYLGLEIHLSPSGSPLLTQVCSSLVCATRMH
jgi:hypothetical protein